VIVGGLSAWLGKVWANRIIETQKALHSEKLERVKAELNLKIEEQRSNIQLLRERTQRFSSVQFELYAELWRRLQDLRFIADDLWEKATRDNLFAFVACLIETRKAVEKSALFLENQHYKELRKTLDLFQEFQMGKKKLIEIRSNDDFNEAFETDKYDYAGETRVGIQQQILANHILKQGYEALLERVRASLKGQITGTPNNAIDSDEE
jgi:hypothetical protein